MNGFQFPEKREYMTKDYFDRVFERLAKEAAIEAPFEVDYILD